MNSCVSISKDLDAYRDGVLQAERQRQVEVHVGQCDQCRAALQQATEMEAQIRSEAQNWKPSPQLWSRIRQSTRHNRPGQERSSMYRATAAWMSAAVLLITVSFSVHNLLQTDPEHSAEAVASALINEFHTFVVSHRELDYSNTQPDSIRGWFGDKVDFRVPLPVRSVDLKLAGGRLCNMFDQRIASFMYKVDGAWVSLYIMRRPSQNSSPDVSHELLLQGYTFIDWESEGLHYSLVGDLPVERLREVAKSLRTTRFLTLHVQPPAVTGDITTNIGIRDYNRTLKRQWHI